MTSRTLGSMDTTTLSLGGHAKNTDRNDVRLRVEAHVKGYRGSSLRGASPDLPMGRIAVQVSPLQSDSGPRGADTNFTATISRANYQGRGQRTCHDLLVLWLDDERRIASSSPPRRYLRYGL
jgi:hypothetical protein